MLDLQLRLVQASLCMWKVGRRGQDLCLAGLARELPGMLGMLEEMAQDLCRLELGKLGLPQSIFR